MFTIDLLKGQGIPEKPRPKGVAMVVVGFAIPVIIAIAILGYYLHTRIDMSIQRQRIINYEAKTNELADAVELQRKFEKDKSTYKSCLSEVSTSVVRHTQWSPILVTLVENIPDSVVLTGLEVKQRFVKKKVPKKGDAKTKVVVSMPQRTLKMKVCGRPQSDCDEAVRDFQDRLRASSLLGPRLSDITVSQDIDRLGGEAVVSYEINCEFKVGL